MTMMGFDKDVAKEQLAALAESLGVEVKDPDMGIEALRGLVQNCGSSEDSEDSEEDDSEEMPMRKGKGPSLAILLGKGR